MTHFNGRWQFLGNFLWWQHSVLMWLVAYLLEWFLYPFQEWFLIYFSNPESPLLSTIVFSMVEDRRLSGKSSHSISKTLETPLITKLLLLKFLLLFCNYLANIVIAKMISCKTLLAIAERSYTFNKILWHDSFEF